MTELEWIYIMLWLYLGPILLVAFFGLVGFFVYWEFWATPQESKIIRTAKRKKKPLVGHVGDEGDLHFEVLPVLGREGYAATSKKIGRKWFGFFPRSQKEPAGVDIKNKIAGYLAKLSTTKTYLADARVPIWFAYSGKAILTSLYSLAGLKLTENVVEAFNGGTSLGGAFEQATAALESVKTVPATPQNTFTVVDFQQIKSLFPKPWDQSQLRAQEVDAHTEGTLEGKKFFGLESMKWILIPIVFMCCLFGMAMIFAYFFS